VSQSWHVPPPFPHVGKTGASVHELPAQQPPPHEFASQAHPPFTHSWPGEQLGPLPQVHTLPPQPSPVVPHPKQPCAPVPHCVAEGVSHVLPLQQPPPHEFESHVQVPPTHSCPGLAHVAQAAP
jgi:hypothetical protein